MAKDDGSAINPFTRKKHFDMVDDDKLLQDAVNEYYQLINQSQLLDNTSDGQIIKNVAIKLIQTVENYLAQIGRSDYTQDYYEWDFHLVGDDTVNAFCMPGGKIVMFSGILSIANTPEKVDFILGHEMAHALLDHTRTKMSAQNTQNAITSVAWIGSIAMDLFGLGSLGLLTRVATNFANIGSQFFLMNPWGRDQELEADRLGMMIIHLAGFDFSQIPSFWQEMSMHNSNEHDFFSTHPADFKIIAVMREIENQKDFYLQPILNEVPTPKKEFIDSSNNVGFKYCSNCGNKFEDAFKCLKCGENVNIWDVFCMNCGNKL